MIAKLTTTLFLAAALVFDGCGGGSSRPDPSSFAKDWTKFEAVNFTIYTPPNSSKSRQGVIAFGDACDDAYTYASKQLKINTDDDIGFYLFNSTEDCEKATGRPAEFTDGLNIFSRIGAPVGGLIGEALCNTIDPAAPSFPLLRNGIRNLFDQRDINVHAEAAAVRATHEWPSIEDLLDPAMTIDSTVYQWASASFVAFLIQRYGIDQFRHLWRSSLELRPSIEKIYGGTLPDMEEEWFRIQDRRSGRS